jgi:hypothetical protein
MTPLTSPGANQRAAPTHRSARRWGDGFTLDVNPRAAQAPYPAHFCFRDTPWPRRSSRWLDPTLCRANRMPRRARDLHSHHGEHRPDVHERRA